jgi:hypothetical protein
MATIYLSSTFEDLRGHRDALRLALTQAGHLVKESYVASAARATVSCLEDVAASDYYVGIFAYRYGYIPDDVQNPEGVSITELEYREAVAKGKEPLLFVMDPRHPWPNDEAHNDSAPNAAGKTGAKINQLRARLQQNHRPALFGDDGSLTTAVLLALNAAIAAREQERQRREEESRRRQQQRAAAPAMDPEARVPHPRELPNALFLLHLDGDGAAAKLLKTTLDKNGQHVRALSFSEGSILSLQKVDELLSTCRTAAVLFSRASLAAWQRLEKRLAPLFTLLRAQTDDCVGLLSDVRPEDLPASTRFGRELPLGTWFGAGQSVVSGQLADFLTRMQDDRTDFDHAGLIGLQYTVIAMNRSEAEALAKAPDAIRSAHGDDCYDYFKRVTGELAKQSDWTTRYDAERTAWCPFGDGVTIREFLREMVTEINELQVVPKRDMENLKGYKVRPRYYPFELLAADDSATARLNAGIKHRGCLVIADELSLLDRRLREAAQLFLDDRKTCVVALSPNDPMLDPLDAATKIQRNVGTLIGRFKNDLDPRCEIAISGRARLRRWLRFSVPEALGSAEARGPDPEARTRVLAELSL